MNKKISSQGLQTRPHQASPSASADTADIEDIDDDLPQDAELLLSTHMTVVVRARLLCSAGGADELREAGLVIARQHCAGERPLHGALQAAAERCAAIAAIAPDQIQARIGGRWVTLHKSRAEPIANPKGMNPMNTSSTPIRRFHAAAAIGCAGLMAWATATPAVAGTAETKYRQERANCLNGQTSQDRQTCLREAGAALQEARRGGLTDPTPAVLAQNAVARCQNQPKENREDCMRLARGEGTQQGTVGEGAIVREVATVKVEPPAAGASAPRSN